MAPSPTHWSLKSYSNPGYGGTSIFFLHQIDRDGCWRSPRSWFRSLYGFGAAGKTKKILEVVGNHLPPPLVRRGLIPVGKWERRYKFQSPRRVGGVSLSVTHLVLY